MPNGVVPLRGHSVIVRRTKRQIIRGFSSNPAYSVAAPDPPKRSGHEPFAPSELESACCSIRGKIISGRCD